MADVEPAGARFEQHVTAVNGFAYGVIGADIHVFSSGEPLYLLANWQPEAEADIQWLRQLPSRMLNARRAVVPFTGRTGELAELLQWRDGGSPRLGARWLHAQGGQGKTRLAAQLAATSQAAGWRVIAAFHGPDADRPGPGSQDMTLESAAGLLVIVDYADRWLLSNLTWFLKNALLHQIGVRTRILMIGRGLDAWPMIKGLFDAHQADTSAQHLQDLPADAGRTDMFISARDRFADIYRLTTHTSQDLRLTELKPPSRLHDLDSEFGLTLAVHMAALVAVDAAVDGQRPPDSMDALTEYLLNREQLHWARLYHDGRTTTGAAYKTPAPVMNQAVFTAALTGAMEREAGGALLERLHIGADAGQVITDHRACYPPTDAGRQTALEPLYPDRLTEDFLALTMPGHHNDYPAQDWASVIATALITQTASSHLTGPEGTPTGYLARAITFLAAATYRWPHLGRGYLYPLLQQHPELAIRAGGTALNTLASSQYITIEVLEAIEPLLPRGRHIDLDIAAATISGHLTSQRLGQTNSPADQAHLLNEHAFRLVNAGQYAAALPVAEEACQIYRALVEANPGTHLPNLARSLDDLATCLFDLGRHDQALPPAEESAGILRQLAEGHPGLYLPDLAAALNNLGNRLSGLGRGEQALASTEEAVAIRRQLAAAKPDSYLPLLAMSLVNLAARLSELGRREQTLAPAEQAISILRRLADADPDAYLPSLGTALNNQGNHLSGLGRREQALPLALEAVTIRRRLAKANPDAYQSDLAAALHNLGNQLSHLGRRDQALSAAEEGVSIYRRLGETNPDANLAGLAGSLHSFAVRLSELGRDDQALPVADESVRIYRRLADANPDAHLAGLAGSLHSFAIHMSEMGRRERALPAAEEALRIYRRLADANPDAYLPDLATALNSVANQLSGLGRFASALPLAKEAVDIRRRLAKANPDAYLEHLAMALNNLGVRLSELGRPREALPASEEAVRIYRQLTRLNADAYLHDLAMALNNIGVRQSQLRRPRRALPAAEEAVSIYRQLADANPDAYVPDLAMALNNLGNRLSELGRREQALATTEESVTIRRRLAKANPDAYLPGLATSLSNLGVRLSELGRWELALPPAEEAVTIWQRLAGPNPDVLLPNHKNAYQTLANVLTRLHRRDDAAALLRQMKPVLVPDRDPRNRLCLRTDKPGRSRSRAHRRCSTA